MSADEPIASGRRRDAVRWRDRLSRGVRVARVRREADAQGEAAHCAVSTPRFPWAVYPTLAADVPICFVFGPAAGRVGNRAD
eukprot:scaffold24197_cov63-Phaeocystis_antarctica.AAC.4